MTLRNISKKNCMNNEKFAEMSSGAPPPHPGAAWRQLADRESGFPYYWNTHTNQVLVLHTHLIDKVSEVRYKRTCIRCDGMFQ